MLLNCLRFIQIARMEKLRKRFCLNCRRDLALFEINNLDGMRFESFMTDKTGETLIYLSCKDDREEILYCVKIKFPGVTILQILPKGGGENEVHS